MIEMHGFAPPRGYDPPVVGACTHADREITSIVVWGSTPKNREACPGTPRPFPAGVYYFTQRPLSLFGRRGDEVGGAPRNSP